MRAFAIMLALVTGVSLALVQAYSVEPIKQAWSGWTASEFPNNYVSEIVTCCWDEL